MNVGCQYGTGASRFKQQGWVAIGETVVVLGWRMSSVCSDLDETSLRIVVAVASCRDALTGKCYGF